MFKLIGGYLKQKEKQKEKKILFVGPSGSGKTVSNFF